MNKENGITRREFFQTMAVLGATAALGGLSGSVRAASPRGVDCTGPFIHPGDLDQAALAQSLEGGIHGVKLVQNVENGFDMVDWLGKKVGEINKGKGIARVDPSIRLEEEQIAGILSKGRCNGIYAVQVLADGNEPGKIFYNKDGQLASALYPQEWQNKSSVNVWAIVNNNGETEIYTRASINPNNPIIARLADNGVWVEKDSPSKVLPIKQKG